MRDTVPLYRDKMNKEAKGNIANIYRSPAHIPPSCPRYRGRGRCQKMKTLPSCFSSPVVSRRCAVGVFSFPFPSPGHPACASREEVRTCPHVQRENENGESGSALFLLLLPFFRSFFMVCGMV